MAKDTLKGWELYGDGSWGYKAWFGVIVARVERRRRGWWSWSVRLPQRLERVYGTPGWLGATRTRLHAMRLARAEMARIAELCVVPSAQLHKLHNKEVGYGC